MVSDKSIWTAYSREVKSLDTKRREYRALSKTISQYILEQILSGEATENVVVSIHECLTTIGDNVREGKTKLEDFIVFKRLDENPEDYPDAKSQPHIQVTMRLKSKGGTARAGDVIPYVFCLAEGEETAKTAQLDRAEHPDEVRRTGSSLRIDFEHYLSQQVLPPIERLCLNLDRYRSNYSGGEDNRTFTALDSQMSDTEKFRDAVPFIVECRECKGNMPFAPIHERQCASRRFSPSARLISRVKPHSNLRAFKCSFEAQIRRCVSWYYEGWTVCGDSTCGIRTQTMGVYGWQCLRAGCGGTVRFEYGDEQMYNQLRYFASLFDPDAAYSTHYVVCAAG
ncbi:DNA polymerase alpha zinc finger-domain-containing protein, partial [Infundibulicybe gibba]